MRTIAAIAIALISLTTQAQVGGFGPDKIYFIKNGKAINIHNANYSIPETEKDVIVSEGDQGDVFANYIVGAGNFYVYAKVKIVNPGGTAAAFQLGKNYFGFDGRQNDIYLNGPIFGREVKSLKSNQDIISADTWFEFEIIRRDKTIEFLIDDVVIHTVEYEDEFKGKMGFHPIRARMEISDFSAKGALVPVSLQKPGFTIPIVDLSAETDRQLVIDKDEKKYLGHPTTVLLEDGKSMYIVYPQGHGGGKIVMRKSNNRGKSWSKSLEVPENWASSKEVPTLYPTIDKSGKKRIIMFSGLKPIRMAFSEDNGKSWSELEPIFDFGGIVAMGDMIRLKNGDYMAFFHDDSRFINGDMKRGRFTVYSTTSKDGGLSWGNPQLVVSHKYMALCEPGVVRSPDGKQIAMLLRENSRQYNSSVIFSNDEGQTWTKPRELPASLTGDRHQCLYANDGRLVITFRDHTFESTMQGDFVAWVGTYDDLVEGNEGQYRVRLLDNKSAWDCGYPAFEIFPDGSFYAATYGKWDRDNPNYLMSCHFTLDEIEEKAKEIPEYTDVFRQGEDNYHTYRIPAIWYTQNGTLLAFAEGRESKSDHAANDIVLKRSTDEGKSWGPLQIVANQGDDCLNNPMIVQDEKSGRLILMYQKYPLGYHEREVGVGYDSDTVCRSYIQYSNDDGLTWTDAKEITEMVKRPTYVTSIAGGPGRGIQLSQGPNKGRIIMPFNQGPAPNWRVYAVYSDDGGENWEYGEVAFEQDNGRGNEVQMVELSDGSVMLNSRSAGARKLRKIATSVDGGENWTGLKNDPTLVEPQCMGSIINVNSSSLDKPALIFSIPYTNQGRKYGTLMVSFDDGANWSINKSIYRGSYAYSCLTDLSGEGIGVLFERDDYSAISFLKTDLDWLIRKK